MPLRLIKYEYLPVRFVKWLLTLFLFPSNQSWFWNDLSYSSDILLYFIWFLLLFRLGLYCNLKRMLEYALNFPSQFLVWFVLWIISLKTLGNSRKYLDFAYARTKQNKRQWKLYCVTCFIDDRNRQDHRLILNLNILNYI